MFESRDFFSCVKFNTKNNDRFNATFVFCSKVSSDENVTTFLTSDPVGGLRDYPFIFETYLVIWLSN